MYKNLSKATILLMLAGTVSCFGDKGSSATSTTTENRGKRDLQNIKFLSYDGTKAVIKSTEINESSKVKSGENDITLETGSTITLTANEIHELTVDGNSFARIIVPAKPTLEEKDGIVKVTNYLAGGNYEFSLDGNVQNITSNSMPIALPGEHTVSVKVKLGDKEIESKIVVNIANPFDTFLKSQNDVTMNEVATYAVSLKEKMKGNKDDISRLITLSLNRIEALKDAKKGAEVKREIKQLNLLACKLAESGQTLGNADANAFISNKLSEEQAEKESIISSTAKSLLAKGLFSSSKNKTAKNFFQDVLDAGREKVITVGDDGVISADGIELSVLDEPLFTDASRKIAEEALKAMNPTVRVEEDGEITTTKNAKLQKEKLIEYFNRICKEENFDDYLITKEEESETVDVTETVTTKEEEVASLLANTSMTIDSAQEGKTKNAEKTTKAELKKTVNVLAKMKITSGENAKLDDIKVKAKEGLKTAKTAPELAAIVNEAMNTLNMTSTVDTAKMSTFKEVNVTKSNEEFITDMAIQKRELRTLVDQLGIDKEGEFNQESCLKLGIALKNLSYTLTAMPKSITNTQNPEAKAVVAVAKGIKGFSVDPKNVNKLNQKIHISITEQANKLLEATQNFVTSGDFTEIYG